MDSIEEIKVQPENGPVRGSPLMAASWGVCPCGALFTR
jgi:hypothetical protein